MLNKLVRKIRSFFPSAVPIGMTEFNKWADDIIELSGAPKNETSKFALSAILIHSFKPHEAYIPKNLLKKHLMKGMANQVAGEFMWEQKEKQKAEEAKKKAEALAAQKPAETTGAPALSVVSNGQKQ